MNLENTLYLTFDIDWVCDKALEHTVRLLRRLNVTATFFVTHQTPLLETIRQMGFELGIHPNFDRLFEGEPEVSAVEIVRNLKKIVPEAVSVRSHALTKSAKLSALFLNEGFTHEANLLIPAHTGIKLTPYDQPAGLLQLTHNWGDYAFLAGGKNASPADYLNIPGLKVLNFHPIHLFLNSNNLSRYDQAKQFTRSCDRLSQFVNRTEDGIVQYLEALVVQAQTRGFQFDQINNISLEEHYARND